MLVAVVLAKKQNNRFNVNLNLGISNQYQGIYCSRLFFFVPFQVYLYTMYAYSYIMYTAAIEAKQNEAYGVTGGG